MERLHDLSEKFNQTTKTNILINFLNIKERENILWVSPIN